RELQAFFTVLDKNDDCGVPFLSSPMAQLILWQALRNINTLHKQNLYHGDIKMKNIVVKPIKNQDGCFRTLLIDFESCRKLSKEDRTGRPMAGLPKSFTWRHLPPDAAMAYLLCANGDRTNPYAKYDARAADLWAFASMILEKTIPNFSVKGIGTNNTVVRPGNIPEDLWDLLGHLGTIIASERYCTAQIEDHAWYIKYRDMWASMGIPNDAEAGWEGHMKQIDLDMGSIKDGEPCGAVGGLSALRLSRESRILAALAARRLRRRPVDRRSLPSWALEPPWVQDQPPYTSNESSSSSSSSSSSGATSLHESLPPVQAPAASVPSAPAPPTHSFQGWEQSNAADDWYFPTAQPAMAPLASSLVSGKGKGKGKGKGRRLSQVVGSHPGAGAKAG
ncbi:unnamed protein product, partial [Choristocarpus tenellus]